MFIAKKKRLFALLLLAVSIGFASNAFASDPAPGAVSNFDIVCSGDTPGRYNECLPKPAYGIAIKISIETTRPPVFNLATKSLERGAGNHPILLIPDGVRFYDFAKSAAKILRVDSALIKRTVNLPGGVSVSDIRNLACYIPATFHFDVKSSVLSSRRIRPPPSVFH